MITITIGILGILSMSILFPLLSIFFSPNYKKRGDLKNNSINEIEVLVPAHNEENSLQQTIKSIENTKYKNLKIHIGIDASTDNSLAIAASSSAKVTVFNHKNKWETLLKLINTSNARWVALTDAGTIWPQNIMQCVEYYLPKDDIVCIAPSYKTSNPSIIESIHWIIERFFKMLENFSGGPTSVHGACVFYKTDILKNVLTELANTNWINDDVVIPLLMQKYGKIQYLNISVSDVGIRKEQFYRRKRILLGNLEWIKFVLPKLLKTHPVIFLKAQRRVFRVFWAYWLTLFFLGLKFPYPLVLFFFAKEAVLNSYMAPIFLFKLHKEIKHTKWT